MIRESNPGHMHGKNLKISDEKKRFHHNLTFEIVNNTEITQSIAIFTKRKIWGMVVKFFPKLKAHSCDNDKEVVSLFTHQHRSWG